MDYLGRPFPVEGKEKQGSRLTPYLSETVFSLHMEASDPGAFTWLTFQQADIHLPTLSQPHPKLPLPWALGQPQ